MHKGWFHDTSPTRLTLALRNMCMLGEKTKEYSMVDNTLQALKPFDTHLHPLQIQGLMCDITQKNVCQLKALKGCTTSMRPSTYCSPKLSRNLNRWTWLWEKDCKAKRHTLILLWHILTTNWQCFDATGEGLVFLDMFAPSYATVVEPVHKARLQHCPDKKCSRVKRASWLRIIYIYLVSGLVVGQGLIVWLLVEHVLRSTLH
jgi:hypothetical protein